MVKVAEDVMVTGEVIVVVNVSVGVRAGVGGGRVVVGEKLCVGGGEIVRVSVWDEVGIVVNVAERLAV